MFIEFWVWGCSQMMYFICKQIESSSVLQFKKSNKSEKILLELASFLKQDSNSKKNLHLSSQISNSTQFIEEYYFFCQNIRNKTINFTALSIHSDLL